MPTTIARGETPIEPTQRRLANGLTANARWKCSSPNPRTPRGTPVADQVPGMQLARRGSCVKSRKALQKHNFSPCYASHVRFRSYAIRVPFAAASAGLEAAVRPAPPLRPNILGFQPGDGLLEPPCTVTIAGIVGGMAKSCVGNLLLQFHEVLVVCLREFGEVERLLLHLLVQRLERGPAIDQLGEMFFDLGGRRLRLQEGDALECARAIECVEQFRLWAFAHPLGQSFGGDAGMVEDRASELG